MLAEFGATQTTSMLNIANGNALSKFWKNKPGGTRQGDQPNQDLPGGTRQGGQPSQD